MKISVSSESLERASADALVAVCIDGAFSVSTANNALKKHLKAYEKDAAAGRTRREWFCTLEKGSGCRTPHLLLDSASFGTTGLTPEEALKTAAARCVELCRAYSLKRLAIAVPKKGTEAAAGNIAEGILLGDFLDTRFKGRGGDKDDTRRPGLQVTLLVPSGELKAARKEVSRRLAICDGQNTARQLVNAPHHVLTPQAMANHARALAKRFRMKFRVLDEKALKRNGFLTWHVGRGSEYPPRVMVLSYRPAKIRAKTHLALVGKGITFDTGGLCIKTRQSMHHMNNDMGGAAAVLGAMETIARLKLPIRVTCIVGAAHNAVDGAAYNPGCVLTARNGKTVYVENTDAEGRLVLSDCLFEAGREKADMIWDVATLTGAASAALGSSFGALFANDEELRELLMGAGRRSGDAVWPLPLVPEYVPNLRHHLADLNNVSSEPQGGAIHAANFLSQFVPQGARWAHVDIAGIADTRKKWRYFRPGATGFGVRLIVEAVRTLTGEKG